MRNTSLLWLLLVPFLVAADAPAPGRPKSLPAVAAVAKADKAVADAEAAAKAAAVKARQTEIEELKAAKSAALKAQNLDEANAIANQIKAVQAEADEPKPKGFAGAKAPAVEIIAARFGTDGVVPVDITVQSRKWLRGTVLEVPKQIWREVGHDWPTKSKWAEVTASVNGTPITVKVPDDVGLQVDFAPRH